MNDVIESAMSFINENTNTLIFICIFLIVVLVIYLIESSIKGKRIEKKMQAEKQQTQELVDLHNKEVKKELEKKENDKKFLDAVENDEVQKISLNVENLETPVEEKSEETDLSLNAITDSSDVSSTEPEKEEQIPEVDVMYKNDKKLSEILFGDIEKQPEGKLDSSIVKDTKEETIEELNSVEELEQIMQKLNSYNNNTNE